MSRPWWPCFLSNQTHFELIQDIIGTILLTKFHDDRKIIVTSRVFTRKKAPPLSWPYIIKMILRTEFHEDRTIIVASRVKNALPFGGHVIQANVTIFKLIQDIIKTNLLTKFHQDWKINVASRVLTRTNAPPPDGHLHEDQTINEASRVLTRFYYSHIRKNAPSPGGHFYEDQTIKVASRVKNAPPLGSHVFQANVTIETNLLTKFQGDWQMLNSHNARRTTDDGRRTKGDQKSSP
ncbi:hypothetical protein DPMN_056352 [Dreissena polymorpha]|uniref:Uncharacterized protein n=1 Tax=Dreissena polymorpha TaxID=45954 RepID=A0A9D4CRI9_DREPO|nr:hypothetical protein DPMN_056352 [Dreissena polymorpha]